MLDTQQSAMLEHRWLYKQTKIILKKEIKQAVIIQNKRFIDCYLR